MRSIVSSLFVILILATNSLTAEPDKKVPQVEITNGIVKLKVFLPDAKDGYYRGPRFDWSGLIAKAEYKGHVFFAPWKTTHDPNNFEDAIGPCEEFGNESPLGYKEAKVGETFVKIGVGQLEKAKNENYNFFFPYKIVKSGTWKVTPGKDQIEFVQELQTDAGWGYQYVKQITLPADSLTFVISHRLKNTGSKPLETNHYNHNFTIIDNDPIGTNYRLKFPWPVSAKAKDTLRGAAVTEGKELIFKQNLQPGQSAYSELLGYGTKAEDNEVTIENTKTGASIKIKGDMPLAKFNFWSVKLAACPEPFIELKLMPGQEAKWQWEYTLQVREGERN